jgi:hypothetical protein
VHVVLCPLNSGRVDRVEAGYVSVTGLSSVSESTMDCLGWKGGRWRVREK